MKNEDMQNLRKMLGMLPKYKRKFYLVFFLVCLSTIIALIQPQIWSRLLNGITIKFSIMILIIYAVMMLTSQLFEIYFELLQVRITQMVQQSLVVEMRKKLISNVINMHIQNYMLINKGELLSRIVSDTEEIANGIVGELISIAVNVVKIILIGIFLCITNVYLGIFTIVFQSIISFILHRHETKIREKCFESSNVNDSYFADMEMIIGGVVEIQNLGIENEISKKVDNIVEEKKKVYLDLVKCNMRYQGEVQVTNFVYQFLVLVIGIQFLDVGMINFRNFVAFSSYSSIFATAITAIYGLKASYINCFNSMKRFNQLFDNDSFSIINTEKRKNMRMIDSLVLKDVSFSYLPEQTVIKHVDASVMTY